MSWKRMKGREGWEEGQTQVERAKTSDVLVQERSVVVLEEALRLLARVLSIDHESGDDGFDEVAQQLHRQTSERSATDSSSPSFRLRRKGNKGLTFGSSIFDQYWPIGLPSLAASPSSMARALVSLATYSVKF
jgi:hypothetical protein